MSTCLSSIQVILAQILIAKTGKVHIQLKCLALETHIVLCRVSITAQSRREDVHIVAWTGGPRRDFSKLVQVRLITSFLKLKKSNVQIY